MFEKTYSDNSQDSQCLCMQKTCSGTNINYIYNLNWILFAGNAPFIRPVFFRIEVLCIKHIASEEMRSDADHCFVVSFRPKDVTFQNYLLSCPGAGSPSKTTAEV